VAQLDRPLPSRSFEARLENRVASGPNCRPDSQPVRRGLGRV